MVIDRVLMTWAEDSVAASSPTLARTLSNSSIGGSSSSAQACPFRYGLDANQFASAFPFHIVFSRDLSIKQVIQVAENLLYLQLICTVWKQYCSSTPIYLRWGFYVLYI